MNQKDITRSGSGRSALVLGPGVTVLLALFVAGCGDDGGGTGGGGGADAGAGGGAGEGGAADETGVSIQCGSETCSYCCNYGECAGDEDACMAGGDEGGRPILRCDGAEDCASDDQRCCSNVPAGSFAIVAECYTLEECHSFAMPLFFCHDHEDCGEFAQCVPWDLASYVNVCESL